MIRQPLSLGGKYRLLIDRRFRIAGFAYCSNGLAVRR